MNRLFNRLNQIGLQGCIKVLVGLDKANSAFFTIEKIRVVKVRILSMTIVVETKSSLRK